jgi:[acyl-carrier-protein] S-malonyltransferase
MAQPAKVAYVFPGQGAQWVGMGRDLYESSDSAREVFEQADEALGFPLSQLCFNGPEEDLCLTVNVQPAIVAFSLALLSAAKDARDDSILPPPTFVAGHSLGEYTALAAAGALNATTTIRLARERGRLMHQAGLTNPGGMTAIIGLDEASLTEVCAQTDTRIANYNCPGQLVISGGKENLYKAAALAEDIGAHRVIPLQVSGAFHTPLMQPAADGLAEVINSIPFAAATIPIIANTTANEITTPEMIKEELLHQLCHGVQWQRSVEYMIDKGVTTFIEIGPGKVLSGLIKRIDKSVKTINIGNAQDIENLSC